MTDKKAITSELKRMFKEWQKSEKDNDPIKEFRDGQYYGSQRMAVMVGLFTEDEIKALEKEWSK